MLENCIFFFESSSSYITVVINYLLLEIYYSTFSYLHAYNVVEIMTCFVAHTPRLLQW